MIDDSISIAAAILMQEFVRKDGLDASSAVREWRRMRRNMIKTLAREEEKIAIEAAVAAGLSSVGGASAAEVPVIEEPEPEPAPVAPAPRTSRARKPSASAG